MTPAPIPVVINGRFLCQRASGVQRYATEVTRRLLQMPDRLSVRVLTPHNITQHELANEFRAETVGRTTGHLWEQTEFPRALGGSIALCLGNTGPMATRNQIVVIHDAAVFAFPSAYSRAFRLWYRMLLPILGRKAEHVITDSAFSASELNRYRISKRNKTTVIHLGSDHLSEPRRTDPEAEALLREYRLRPKGYVVAVGNRHPAKNLAVLQRAMECQELTGLRAVIVGGTPTVAQSDITTARANHRIHQAGYVPDLQLVGLYRNALAAIAPSKYEGFGLTPLEAMRAGCPSIVADTPVTREVCGTASSFFAPDDAAGLAAIITKMHTELPEARSERITNGLRHAAQFTWDETVEKIAALIERNAQSKLTGQAS
jgi:glycosyltransferase involved in cell wall biosynthesis